MASNRKIKRIPPELLAEQWFSFVHSLIEGMQVAYRKQQARVPGFNQLELAAKLGRKPSFISRCLSGQQNMTIRTIHDLARGMDCRLEVTWRPLRSLTPANLQPAASAAPAHISVPSTSSATSGRIVLGNVQQVQN
jgi:hypothetical protein